MLIRECTHRDIDEILQLERQWGQENITHYFVCSSRETVIDYLEHFPVYFFVAENNEGIVGYINGFAPFNEGGANTPEEEPCLEIHNIYVKPDFRGRGIGSKLMERLLATAEQNGIQSFLVDSVSTDMDKVINFYRSHGFTLGYVELFK